MLNLVQHLKEEILQTLKRVQGDRIKIMASTIQFVGKRDSLPAPPSVYLIVRDRGRQARVRGLRTKKLIIS